MSLGVEAGRISLRAQDIQTGLQEYDVDEFRTLTETGWAARIAIHLRSSGPVEYDRLKAVAQHLFGVNQWGFQSAVDILQEANFARIIGGTGHQHIVPQNIPYFNDLYPVLDSVAESRGLNEHEQISIQLLDRLAKSPAPKDQLLRETGADRMLFDRALAIGRSGSYLDMINTRNMEVLASPLYFSENPKAFADVVAKYGDQIVAKVLELMRQYPGCPLAEVEAGRIGDAKLSGEELDAARLIARRAIAQPPGITTPSGQTNLFLFTPKIGTSQIEVIEKEVYERAIEVVAAIRHGQHYAAWKVTHPSALLVKLRRGAPISPPPSVREQYVRLGIKKIVRFDPPPPASFRSIVFVDTPENRKAIDLAIEMLDGNAEPTRSGSADATELLKPDVGYLEFIRGIKRVRSRKQVPRSEPEVSAHLDKLLEHCMKGA